MDFGNSVNISCHSANNFVNVAGQSKANMNVTDSPPRTFIGHVSEDNFSGCSKLGMELVFNKQNVVLNWSHE